MGVALVVAAIISLIFGALSGRSAAIASAGFAKNLRHDMFYNVQGFSFSNIDKFSTASIVTRLTTDITNIQNAYQMIIRIAVRCPVMLIFSLIMAFSINHQLAHLFGLYPNPGVGLYLIMSKAHPIFERVFKTYDKLNNVVQENLRGIRVVKSFVREDYEKEKFWHNFRGYLQRFFKGGKRRSPTTCRSCSFVFCEYAADFVVRRAFDRRLHHDDRRADELNHLYDADFNEPDDAFYGICYDYHLPRIGGTNRRGAK